MFAGGIVTVFVTNMERSVRFYTEQLGLKLLQRYENQFASGVDRPGHRHENRYGDWSVPDRADPSRRDDAEGARHHVR